MFGQGRPKRIPFATRRFVDERIDPSGQLPVYRVRRTACALWALWLLACLLTPLAVADGELRSNVDARTVALRIAWGGAPTRWSWEGRIRMIGADLESFRQFGVEADVPGSMWIENETLHIGRRGGRTFDGVDIAFRMGDAAVVQIELVHEGMRTAKVVAIPVADVLRGVHRSQFDTHGNELVVHRAPGDQLRFDIQRPHLVFAPREDLELRVASDPVLVDRSQPQVFQLALKRADSGDVLLTREKIVQPTRVADTTDVGDWAAFSIELPDEEGVYDVALSFSQRRNSAIRFVPSVGHRTLGRRTMQLVVVDDRNSTPALPETTDAPGWRPILDIDPANPAWWSRLPRWAQVQRLAGYPQGPLQSAPLRRRRNELGNFVELPASESGDEPHWLAYPLPLEKPHVAHLLTVEYPGQAGQHVGLRILEPDAAGKLDAIGVDSGAYVGRQLSTGKPQRSRHELVIWPRTPTPHLLVTAGDAARATLLGRIRLFQREDIVSETRSAALTEQRLVAGCVANPGFARGLGAGGTPDGEHVIDDWQTFLEGGARLAQLLRHAGYNAAVVTVAADGSAIYPSEILQPTPLHDTGFLSALALDPLRKDALELLYRIFDREGLKLIPAVELTSPLPRLERECAEADQRQAGIRLVGPDGRDWLSRHGYRAGRAPYYNLLNGEVQQAVRELTQELVDRYRDHLSFAGVAISLEHDGYSQLPGPLWGLDDATIGRFQDATGNEIGDGSGDRFAARAQALSGRLAREWQQWRASELTSFYTGLADLVARDASRSKLVLLSTGMLEDGAARAALRPSGRRTPLDLWFFLRGLELGTLATRANLVVPRPHRITPTDPLADRAQDLQLEVAYEIDRRLAEAANPATMFFHPAQQRRLTSFDASVPFGDDSTRTWLVTQALPNGAANRRRFINQLAVGDPFFIIDGGEFLPIGQQRAARHVLEITRQLPTAEARVTTRDDQPVTVKTYREDKRTTVLVINAAPWEAQVSLSVDAEIGCRWEEIAPRGADLTATPGTEARFRDADRKMELTLDPYDVRAFRFQTSSARVAAVTTAASEVARAELQQRLDDLESRTRNLTVERQYRPLENPDFEADDDQAGIPGWEFLSGAGVAEPSLDAAEPFRGERCLRLMSDGPTIAIQSHLFPIPFTRQLTVSFRARGSLPAASNSQLRLFVEDAARDPSYRRYAVVRDRRQGGELGDQWEQPIVRTFDDLPRGRGNRLRIRLELTGPGDVRVDDMQLYDLRFDEQQRLGLAKLWYVADVHLKEGKLVDCLSVLEGYWPRFLIEHVPAERTARVDKTDSKTSTTPEPTFGDRIRGLLPRTFRR